MFNWLKRKKKLISNEFYPLNTCRNFYNYVKDYPKLSDGKLADEMIFLSCKLSVNRADILDLIKVTRDELQRAHEHAEKLRAKISVNLVERIQE